MSQGSILLSEFFFNIDCFFSETESRKQLHLPNNIIEHLIMQVLMFKRMCVVWLKKIGTFIWLIFLIYIIKYFLTCVVSFILPSFNAYRKNIPRK